MTDATAAGFGLKAPEGMVVLGVVAGSAADAAGLRQNDVILKIDGTAVRDLSSLRRLMADAGADSTVPVEILRDGRRHVVPLRLDRVRH